jgi:hypothetical protein
MEGKANKVRCNIILKEHRERTGKGAVVRPFALPLYNATPRVIHCRITSPLQPCILRINIRSVNGIELRDD